MFVDVLRLVASTLPAIPFLFRRLVQKIYAVRHKYTYERTAHPKNVVVVGGSFAGLQLVRRLTETLPTGYRAVLVEPSSHFNFVFNFPRYSVVPGHEAKAFIPHDGLEAGAPEGIYTRIQDYVVKIVPSPSGGGGEVFLADSPNSPLPYEYLVVATGASQPFPARVRSADKAGACAELRALQDCIAATETVAVVGGGAVGVELAADVKSFYPEKRVVLAHSRGQLLPRFGGRLHAHALAVLEKLGVEVILEERPDIIGLDVEKGTGYGPATLRFGDGHEEAFGLAITCTGQKPNSGIIAGLDVDAVSKETGCILVKPTLQVAGTAAPEGDLFAIGDVADTGGPKMGRAGLMQAETVCSNILAMIDGKTPSEVYRSLALEGATKLTLGKTDWVIYMQQENGTEILMSGKGGEEDLGIRRFWKEYGAEFKEGGRD